MDIDSLADEYQQFRYQVAPTWAHLTGEYSQAGRYEDVSRAGEERAITRSKEFSLRAQALPVEGLTEQEQISRAMLEWDAAARASVLELRMVELGVDPIFGPQASVGTYLPKLSLPTAEVAELLPAKLESIAQHFRDRADRHRDGLDNGRPPAAFAVAQVVDQLESWLSTPLQDDPLLAIAPTPDGVDRAALVERLAKVVESDVRPALHEYLRCLREEVAGKARPDEECGLVHLPGGDSDYATLTRFHTTTDLTPQQIHEIGLAQVESLAREYAELGPAVVASSDVPTILSALRDDPSLHHTNGDDVVEASKRAMAKARAAMPEWFNLMPQADCDVEGTTSGAKAYYFRPAKDGSRGGVFFMNVSDPEAWGLFDIESTAFHEGIPGHHLQIALAAELDGIPEFRKSGFVTAYSEGWGLYTERLADEMGLYGGALDRIGMLAADSMRACRLVVDTGMHALGWSRQQAIDYLIANSPMPRSHAEAEIDRYAVTPGQALSYMIGRLEILRMRADAMARQGERFEIKAFHDAVLDSGAMPLYLLEKQLQTRLT
ncbi:MAG TPA: DUF885 domain-containing protein [Nocardioidaceae bacterium]|nr:DUF885 domain-containing protein [Nocardioidaceae bacterium]